MSQPQYQQREDDMKLYHAAPACSIVPIWLARELNLNIEIVDVDLKTKALPDGRDFSQINPNQYVPVLELDNGEILTELPAICLYLASLTENNLVEKQQNIAFFKQISWFNYIATEIHKNFTPKFKSMFGVPVGEGWLSYTDKILQKRYAQIDAILTTQDYLMGNDIRACDFYLYVTLRWAQAFNLDLSAFSGIQAFQQRMASRDSIAV